MSNTLTWVVGRGGLLGSALARALRGAEFRPAVALSWDAADLAERLREAARELAQVVRDSSVSWQVCWCAGAGVVGTSSSALARETQSLRELVLALSEQPTLRTRRGTILLTSSAGGVHAGSEGGRISERDPPRPISPYGLAKWEQEQQLVELRSRFSQLSTLTARFANLYGPEQRLNKAQGLISHMARAVVCGAPVQIYVPLDTMRDYLFVDDAARAVSAGLLRLAASPEPLNVLKIYGSERDTTIATLLAIFRGIAKRRLKIISGLHASSLQQPRQLTFRSTVWPEDRSCRTELLAGVGVVYRHQLRRFQIGRLPPT